MQQVLGAGHYATLAAYNNTAVIHDDLGEQDQAIDIYQETADLMRRELGEDHPHWLTTRVNMAHALAVKKDWLAGKQILDPLLPKLRTQFGDTHPQTVFAVKNLLVILENAGESERAQALQLEFADIAPASESPNFDAFTNTGMACTRRQR